MISIKITDIHSLIAFWLVFSRWICVFFQLPVLEGQSFPPITKVLSCLVIAFAFYPSVENHVKADMLLVGADSFWYLTIINIIIGLVIGLMIKIIMEIYISAAGLIAQQVGFGAVKYFDPQSSQQMGPLEILIQYSILVMILFSGAFIPIFKGIQQSFNSISLGNMSKILLSSNFYLMFFKSIFLSSLSLAAPLIYMNFLLSVVMGIISRTIPQMNILMVSFVVNIGVGLTVFLMTSDEFFNVSKDMYVDHLGQWFQFIK